MSTTDLRYPIGKYIEQPYSDELRKNWLDDIRYLPQLLENAILNLNEDQLQTPYREGGWTIQQVVHHVADSHMNAIIRFKLGMTEASPVIKPYDEAAWAELNDVKEQPINISLTLLHALHARWYSAIKNLSEQELKTKTIFHPEHKKEISLWNLLGTYAWHGKHHVAHITTLRNRMGW